MGGDLVEQARQLKEDVESGSGSSSEGHVESLRRAFDDLQNDIERLEERIESVSSEEQDGIQEEEIDDRLLEIEQELRGDIESIRQDILGRIGEKHGFHQKKRKEVRDELFDEYERMEQRVEELSTRLEETIKDVDEFHNHLVHLSEAVHHALEQDD